jgi:hypothetical protein
MFTAWPSSIQKFGESLIQTGQSERTQASRDVAALQRAGVPRRASACSAAGRRPPPLGIRAPGPHPEAAPSPVHAPTEAASKSCPLLAPHAGRPANAQWTAGPFYASPSRSLPPRPALAPRRRRWSLGSLAGTLAPYKKVTAPPVKAKPRSSCHRRHYWPPRRARGLAGYTPNQALPHLPLHLPKLAGVPVFP